MFDLVLERSDVFERVDDDLVGGLVHRLDFDVHEGLLALLVVLLHLSNIYYSSRL